ncbi:hypothetical protein [Agromyces sp. H66]|uniref:hypothetical protein n=1 Tax=Agromyces sp. H66 TaxID=2529859 RepID=UPI0010A9F01C|nr:hypothetical protein [Agromyces sp. H66]
MRNPSVVALVAVGALAMTGCAASASSPPSPSGVALDAFDPAAGNGLWLLGGDAAGAEIVDSVREAGSVRYSGSFTELVPATPDVDPAPGRSLTIDYAGRPGTATARITAGDLEFDLVMVDGRTYVRGNAAYAERTGIAAAAQGYVCSVGAQTLLDEWAPLLRPSELVASLIDSSESLTVEPPRPGDSTVSVVMGGSEAPIGELTVARSGAPLPIGFTAGDGSGDGAFSFSAWGEPIEVARPADRVVDCDA